MYLRVVTIYLPRYSLLIFAALVVLTIVGTIWADGDKPDAYATVGGTEPDKWASAWLIHRYIAPGAQVVVHEELSPSDSNRIQKTSSRSGETWFDVPGSRWVRSANRLTYQQLLESMTGATDTLEKLGVILNGIEQISWTTPFSADAEAVESTYRQLQAYFFPDPVPLACYYSYFDAVHDAIVDAEPDQLTGWIARLSDGFNFCARVESSNRGALTVPTVPIEDLKHWLRTDQEIVFLDTREPQEFEQRHIPGALNYPLRKLKDADIDALSQSKLVVPYCIKDFRGYQVARELMKMGLNNVAMMKPHGLNGWINAGLPVDGVAINRHDVLNSGLEDGAVSMACSSTVNCKE